jgi:YD repeat-containing protein
MHDANWHRVARWPASDASPAIARTYTSEGLPATGAVWTNTYNKRHFNERESLVYGGTTYNIDRAYDVNGSLAQLKYPDSVAITSPSVSSRSMGYDNLDRLTSVSAPAMWGSASYTYDTLDNLRTSTITSGGTVRSMVHTIDPATNRLTGISGTAGYSFSYLYDLLGNVKQRGAQAYVFDQGNRLKSATGKATYGYDGLGHRFTVVAPTA